MKIYTKIVMDIDTLEIIEEESYEYDGPLALCGGGSGGGSSSGEVDYPSYIKQIVTGKQCPSQSLCISS